MTAARFVTTSFTVAALSVLVLAACGASGPAPGTAEALYVNVGCAKCHGPDREGLRSGPPLVGIGDRWDADSLASYLKDPRSFVETNPRLSYMDEQYPIAMPAYPTLAEEDVQKLVEFILSS
jgi:cytochrome c551/c552